MPKTTIEKLADLGQSAWLDNINRPMIENGKLKDMIASGLRGMTSNPAIFDKSIRLSSDYDKKIEALSMEGRSMFEIYDDLTVKDVQDAADIFKEVYERTGGLDGYVSLEVDPKLSSMAEETIEEARRLFKKVARPNVMFKIPATDEGFEAIEALLSEGININATLIFSVRQYEKTARAFLKGINKFLQRNGDLSKVHSVASVFVSRIDNLADKMIEEKLLELKPLKGKAAVANSKLIYQKHLEIFSRGGFKKMQKKGANIQRVLWGSTSTKNPAYSDIKYVYELIGKNTVNTMPENTLEAFLDHGIAEETLTLGIEEAQYVINTLDKSGININDVCGSLLQDGLIAFEKSFEALLSSIREKIATFCKKEAA